MDEFEKVKQRITSIGLPFQHERDVRWLIAEVERLRQESQEKELELWRSQREKEKPRATTR